MTKINSWARYIHSLPRLLLSSTLSPNISVCHDFLASPVRRAHSCVFNYRGTFNFPPSILDVLDGRSEIIHPVGICGGSRRGEEKRAREASKQAWGRERERERVVNSSYWNPTSSPSLVSWRRAVKNGHVRSGQKQRFIPAKCYVIEHGRSDDEVPNYYYVCENVFSSCQTVLASRKKYHLRHQTPNEFV